MLLLMLAPPAQAQVAPAAMKPIEALLETLEGVPEALIDNKAARIPALIMRVKTQWERSKAQIAASIPGLDAESITKNIANMGTQKPHEQAESALELSAVLSRHVPASRSMQLLDADRTGMLAWCRVDAGRWTEIPSVADAFKPLLDGDQGKHSKAVSEIQVELGRFQEEQAQKSTAKAKHTLQKLLDLIDVLEKP